MQHLDSLLCLPTQKQRPDAHTLNISLSVFQPYGLASKHLYTVG